MDVHLVFIREIIYCIYHVAKSHSYLQLLKSYCRQ